LAATQPTDTTTTQTLEICNVGDAPLDWSLSESEPVFKPAIIPAGPSSPRPVTLSFGAAGGASTETTPPVSNAPVQLVLDDGIVDNSIGIGGTWEFVWVNRFTPAPADFPFNLNQVQIYFPTDGNVNVGDDIIIVVYENTSGNTDPAVGSNFLASFPATVQATGSWNVYDLASPVLFDGPGDVIIGAIAMTVPGSPYWPAAIDTTATQARSWAGWWLTSPPPNPPTLPADDSWGLIDGFGFPGNWMVRGYGETAVDIPWLSEAPTSGTVAPGACETVTVTFDSTGLAEGLYTANLIVTSNDPDTPEITVPVSLTVEQTEFLLYLPIVFKH
jgi:hypothetical protein